MNQYRELQKTKKRGGHCVFGVFNEETKVGHSVFCGCGSREPISKKYNNRIVRRMLQRQLRNELDDYQF